MGKLLSVIVLTYNQERLVKECRKTLINIKGKALR